MSSASPVSADLAAMSPGADVVQQVRWQVQTIAFFLGWSLVDRNFPTEFLQYLRKNKRNPGEQLNLVMPLGGPNKMPLCAWWLIPFTKSVISLVMFVGYPSGDQSRESLMLDATSDSENGFDSESIGAQLTVANGMK